MAHSNYVSLSTGAPRLLTPRRIYYAILGTILAILLIIAVSNRSRQSHHHKDMGFHHDDVFMHSEHHHEIDSYGRIDEHDSRQNVNHPSDTVDKKKATPLATFHPTAEWQIVPEDAILPAGLQIRIDFKTGQKMARLPQPNGGEENHATHLPAAIPTPPRIKTIIEQRLEDLISANPATQRDALEYFDVHAHELNIGASIAHASNFKNLMDLMEVPSESLRLEAASIIAACLHNNKGAIDGALISPLVRRIVGRLSVERDAEIQRRIIAILSYLAEGSLEETIHQFTTAQGFTILEDLLKKGLDQHALLRATVLLAELGRQDSHEKMSPSLALLDRFISKIKYQQDNPWMDSFEPICEMEARGSVTLYPNIHKFCQTSPFTHPHHR